MSHAMLSAELAASFATTALDNIGTALPQRLDRVQVKDEPILPEKILHPAFHGSFDWHSCVHMHWLLVRLMHLFPQASWHEAAIRLLNERLGPRNLDVELAYFTQPENRLFERPYGWAWLFKLHSALHDLQASQPKALHWAIALGPLCDLLVQRFDDYLGRLVYPVRAGTHANTAFAMLLALDLGQGPLRARIEERARAWFFDDRNYPAAYEPDGEDFLSGGLTQAALMSRLLSAPEFENWWTTFRPEPEGWKRWQQAVQPSTRTDGRLVHLAGLNLSRAWCMRQIARRLNSAGDELQDMAQTHLQASLPHVTGEDFAGDHWLASFATLALTA